MGKAHRNWWPWAILGLSGWLGAKHLARATIKKTSNDIVKRLMVDPYQENMWEFVSASQRVSPHLIVETNLRAQDGKVLLRPLGTPRNFHIEGLDKLMFTFSMLEPPLPTPGDFQINTSAVIGPRAKKPLQLDTPIMVSGMAYGLALSEQAKIALAKGSALAGTSTNTGEGPFLSSERKAAKSLVIQYSRGTWNKSYDILRQGDAIEIQIGQGAIGGIGHVMAGRDIDPKLRKQLGLSPGEEAVLHARQPGMSIHNNLPKLVKTLRWETGGIPVGVKMAAGQNLEDDLAILLEAGVDYIALCGAQAATWGSPPIIQDDFGLPTMYAVTRAARFLEQQGERKNVSLIVGGGLFTPGDFLKALALGADAVYIGTIALFAMTHTQVLKAMPFEPPTQMVFYHSNFANRLNIKQAAHHLANFIKSCTAEMAEGVRALGKSNIHEVNRGDLMSLDSEIAAALGLASAWQPTPANRRTVPGRPLNRQQPN